MPFIVSVSMYSNDQRTDAACHDARHGVHDLVERAVRRQHGRVVRRPRVGPAAGASVTSASVPSEARTMSC